MRHWLGVPLLLLAFPVRAVGWRSGAIALWRLAHHVAGEPINQDTAP